MRTTLILVMLFGVVSARAPLEALAKDDPPPLYTNLGSFHLKVATQNPLAQRYIDQGINFLYAFNYGEANRAFRQAATLDANCVMAWWGIAMANGPHINDPTVSSEHSKTALDALQQAQSHLSAATPVERALIHAAEKRYADPAPTDRKALDSAYADAMRQVWTEFPNSADVGAVFAESLMDLRPWDLWTNDKKPQPGTEEILTVLKAVLKLDPTHPLGNHLTIHAWEASPHPEMADDAANRMRTLQPGIAHAVHMPSHIDVLRGRWREAILANEKAIADDRAYLKDRPIRGTYALYMGHNYHMLSLAAMMCGQSRLALRSIDELVARLPAEWVRENAAYADGSGFLAMPLEVRLRFGLWEEVLAAPEPPEYCPVARVLRHYARGVAYAAKGQFPEANAEQAQFHEGEKGIAPEIPLGNNTARDILAVAGRMLAGEILYLGGMHEEGLVELRNAVQSEDALHYDEPPDWIMPTRHALGAALMTSGHYAEAESVYRQDLVNRPDNGWALYGLAQSLLRQGKQQEAKPVQVRFKRVWKDADIHLSSSCLCLPSI